MFKFMCSLEDVSYYDTASVFTNQKIRTMLKDGKIKIGAYDAEGESLLPCKYNSDTFPSYASTLFPIVNKIDLHTSNIVTCFKIMKELDKILSPNQKIKFYETMDESKWMIMLKFEVI